MRLKTIFLMCVLAMFSACSDNTNNHPSTDGDEKNNESATILDKLIGIWQNEDGKSFERWTKTGDGTYQSDGFHIEGKDTMFTEKVNVRHENGGWFSENTVFNQNQGGAIGFTITSITTSELHFNNPTHDFPTDIHYHLVDNNTIHAFIAGPNQSGGRDTIPFNFIRVKI